MPRTPGYNQDVPLTLAGPHYTTQSSNVNAQTTINWYPEIDPAGGKSNIVLYPHLGTKFIASIGSGPHRGAIEHKGVAYFVSGKELYSMDVNESTVLIGSLNTNRGRVGIASNGSQGNQILIVDGTDGWIYDSSANTLTIISDGDFPANATTCSFQDAYFIVTVEGSEQWYISDLNDGTAWTATQFATAERDPDNLKNSISLKRTLYLLGDFTTEMWSNTGGDFPFEPYANGILEKGLAARFSVDKDEKHVYWLAQDKRGNGQVVRASGTTIEIVSTLAMDQAISKYASTSDAEAFIYQDKGHTFYQITFPQAKKTWVYDITIGDPALAWHQKSSKDIEGIVSRHIARTHLFFNNKHYVGDYNTSNLLHMDSDTYTDYVSNAAKSIVRERTGTVVHDQKRGRYSTRKLEIEVESGTSLISGQGSDAQLAVSWSDDGGHTWSNVRTVKIGKLGVYGQRILLHNLGASRNRIYRIRCSDPVRIAIISAYARISFRRY